MRAVLVHNPMAGAKGYDKSSIIEALHLADIEVDYVSTKDDGLRRALNDPCDMVVAAGGDGTINYVLTHLADRSIPVGILPLGSANNIARSIGIAGTPAELAEQWQAGQVRSFHLIEVSYGKDKSALSTEGFGVGLMAAMIKQRAKGKKVYGADGIRRGRQALAALMHDAESLDLEVHIDGKLWKGDLISVDVLNIPFTGPALPLAQNADPGDRFLEVIGIEADKRDRFLEWLRSPQKGTPPVSAQRGELIGIRWRAAPSRIGDQAANGTPDWQQVFVCCASEPLRILVPAKHPAVKAAPTARSEKSDS